MLIINWWKIWKWKIKLFLIWRSFWIVGGPYFACWNENKKKSQKKGEAISPISSMTSSNYSKRRSFNLSNFFAPLLIIHFHIYLFFPSSINCVQFFLKYLFYIKGLPLIILHVNIIFLCSQLYDLVINEMN